MSNLIIEMYTGVIEKEGEDIPVVAQHLGNLVISTIGATQKRTSSDFNKKTKFIVISTDDTDDVFFKLGDETVAATTDASDGSRPLRGVEASRNIAIDGSSRISVIK